MAVRLHGPWKCWVMQTWTRYCPAQWHQSCCKQRQMFRTMPLVTWPAALSVLPARHLTTSWMLLLLITTAIICRVRLIRCYFPISSHTMPRSSLLAMGPGRAPTLYRIINVTHVSQALLPYLSCLPPCCCWVLAFTWQRNWVLFIYPASLTPIRL